MGLLVAVLVSTMMLGAMMSFDSRPDDASDPEDPETPDGPTVGDDILTVAADATGQFDALAGDDTISVNAETGERFWTSTPLDLTWSADDGDYTDDGKASLQITGGAGNDVLDLSGSGYAVTGGEGADLINLGDAANLEVTAGLDDTVVGGTGADVSVLLTETATYQGTDADEVVVNQSSGVVDMGAGNDTVLGVDGGASSVYGGAGDDVLKGSISQDSYSSTASYPLWNETSLDVDTLDGGAGNDTISLSHGDLVTTGTGSDNLSLYLVQNAAYEGADIADFDPALDQMVVYFGSFDAYSMPEPLANTIVVTETSAGDTVITSTNGQVLARLTGVTGLSVGLQLVQGDPLTDLAGVPTPDAAYDVIILRFYEPTS